MNQNIVDAFDIAVLLELLARDIMFIFGLVKK